MPVLLGAAPPAPGPSGGGGAAAGLPLEAAGGGSAGSPPGMGRPGRGPPCFGSWSSSSNNTKKK